jgi:hypothetical protein
MQRAPIQQALLAAIVTVFPAVASRPAQACSCAPPEAAEEAFKGSTAVFLGTVRSVAATPIATSYGPAVEVALDVARVWKGEVSRNQVVVTPNGGSTCGFPFETGRTYLVYVTRNDHGLWATLCSNTRATNQAADELGLGPGSAPLETGADGGSNPSDASRDESGGRASCQAGGMGPPATITGAPIVLLFAWLALARRARR